MIGCPTAGYRRPPLELPPPRETLPEPPPEGAELVPCDTPAPAEEAELAIVPE